MTLKPNKFFLNHYNKKLSGILGTMCKELRITKKDIEIKTTPGDLNAVLYILQNHSLCLYKQLSEMICIDTPEHKLRFSVTYKLYSMVYNSHIYVVTQTDDVTPIPSVSQLYSSATWLEREIWDLFGIFFSDNPDLRRILTDYGFQGHPLRKDFPLTGFVEVYYNDSTKRLAYEPVELAQEYRVMNLESPFNKVTSEKKFK